jgi:hypothetical protein
MLFGNLKKIIQECSLKQVRLAKLRLENILFCNANTLTFDDFFGGVEAVNEQRPKREMPTVSLYFLQILGKRFVVFFFQLTIVMSQ